MSTLILDSKRLTQLLLLFALIAFCGGLAGCSGRSKAEKLHAQGAIFYKNHQYYKAIDKFQEALKLEPNQVGTLSQCADAYLKTDKPEEAIKLAQRVIELEPGNANAYLLIGQSHLTLARIKAEVAAGGERRLNQKELDQVAEIASQLRKKQPDAVEGMLLQARLDQINERPDLARKLYEQALTKAPDNITALLGLTEVHIAKKEFSQAEAVARRTMKVGDKPNPSAIADLALSLAYQRKFNEAYLTLEPYIAEKNMQPDVSHYLLAGRVLVSQIEALGGSGGATAPAAPKAETAPTSGTAERTQAISRLAGLGSVMKGRYPSLPESWYFRAMSYQLQGNLPEAIRHLQEATSRAPESKPYRLALAQVQMMSKNFALARQELRTLLKTYPGDFDGQLRMAQCFASEGSFDESLELLRKLQGEQPQNRDAKETMGKVLVLTSTPENVEKGLALLAEVSSPADQMAPGGKEAWLAQAAIKEGDAKLAAGQFTAADVKFNEAERLFKVALTLNPRNTMAELKLADLATRRDDLFSALTHARNAARIDPQFLPVKAQILLRLGQIEAAEAIYQQLLATNPNALGYQLALADLQYQLGKLDEAQRQYEALMKKYPEDARPWMRQAMLLAKRENLDAASQFLGQSLKKFPNDLNMRMALAQMALKAHKPEQATGLLGEIIQHVESRAAAEDAATTDGQMASQGRTRLAALYQQLALGQLQSGQHQAALATAAKVIATDPSQTYLGLAIKAVAELQGGQTQPALETLKQIQIGGDHMPAALPLIRALAALAAGDLKQAATAVDKQASLNTNTLILFHRMLERNPAAKLQAVAPDLALQVLLMVYADSDAAALALADKALQVLPNEPFILSRKAEALQGLGRAQEALAAYEQLQQVMPDFTPVLMAKVDLRLALADLAALHKDGAAVGREKAAATALCRQYLKKQPKDPDAVQKLAGLVQETGNVAEANKLYRRAIEIDPNNWSAYNNLAWNLVEANQLSEAAAMGEKALKLAAEVGGVQDTLGWIELKRNRADRAVALLSQASLRLPNNPEVRFHLAQALQQKGRTAEALAELETIAIAMPTYKRIEEVRQMLRQLKPESEALTPPASVSLSATSAAVKP